MNIERYGKGPKTLFIHGAGGSTLTWFFQRTGLKEAGEIILVDLPGHGTSPEEGLDSIETFGQAIFGAIGEDGDGYVVVGHSMGGAIAMTMALQSPRSVRGLVLIGTGARLRVFPHILTGIQKDMGSTVKNIIDYAFSPKSPDWIREMGLNAYMKNNPSVVFKDFLACDRFDITGRLRELTMPILIICGTDDRLTPPKYSEFLHREMPSSELCFVEDGGHMVMIEKPDIVNGHLRNFLERLP